MERITAVILAGGTGSRMNRGMPKQFIHVKGKPLILHSVEMFDKNKRITDIILVSHEDHIGTLLNIVKQAGVCKVRRVVPGGKTRQGSSFNGLKACPEGTEIVLIHDAARPFVDDAMIERTIAGAKKYKAVTTAIEVTDTLIEEKKGFVRRVPPR
ncbi:MAG TPA: IspD/TarI family cytidylyltransferase, partial [Candidatus Omnitrophota bacterium]|nr:IspD/TarI family cytidylyltransferase [Candidatus Omnitrophota bacterium]